MKFKLAPTKIFLKQIINLDKKDRARIKSRLLLAEQNPFRYKRLHSSEFSRIFRIRMKIQGKERRVVYILIKDKILATCILDRDRNYRDLKKYLIKLRKELSSR